jgi:membrane-bound lytic murein transglycosylase
MVEVALIQVPLFLEVAAAVHRQLVLMGLVQWVVTAELALHLLYLERL